MRISAPTFATDHSGTITTGGTAQTAIPANARRKGWGVYNPESASENLTVSFLGTAGAGSDIILTAGMEVQQTYGIVASNAISVVAATTSHAFVAWEYE